MNMNPIQLIGMIRNGGNLPQILMGALRQNAGNNPVMQNALDMAEKNDMKGIETLARNLCKEKGVDPNQAYNQAKNMIGIM